MDRFLEVSLGFPTVIFTFLLLVSLGFWLLSFLTGVGNDGGFLDLDVDADLDLDTDLGNGIGSLLRTLHLHHVPMTITLTLLAFVGWFVSSGLTLLLTEGSVAVVPGTGIFIGSLFVAGFLAGRLGQVLAPLFTPPPHIEHQDLVGRLCTVRTGSVSRTFGQAEVVDVESSTHTIQVRCLGPNTLTQGSRALIVSVDTDGLFQISPDVAALT